MKAWLARVKDEFCCTVVFAETSGKARSIALTTDACWGDEFCNIKIRRYPQLDSYYTNGKKEMNWKNAKDRIVLVKECGFRCEYPEFKDCKVCAAKEYCEEYEILMDGLEK